MTRNALHILLVEDDENLGQILKEYLELKGYNVTLCRDGEEGLATFKSAQFDLCILDVMMPKKDGFTLAQEIHGQNQKVPFLFLTAKSMKADAIKGLTIGAEDYITKPFSMEELLLRLNVIFRRSRTSGYQTSDLESYDIGKLKFDAKKRILEVNGNERALTTKENELLKLLCINVGNTLPRKVALEEIWGDDSYFNARSMDVYITKLRKYLKADDSLQILTVHGEGFKLVRL